MKEIFSQLILMKIPQEKRQALLAFVLFAVKVSSRMFGWTDNKVVF